MKKTTENKVMLSVVTPNYNDGNTITGLVDSIMEQDYPYIEHIVVDDGSTDNSKKVLKKLEKKYAPKLKVIFLKKNQGACEARNIGAKEARGKYLSFLPADAKFYPGMARIWVETLEKNPDYDFMYGGYRFTDENGNAVQDYISDSFDPYLLEVNNYIDGSFPLKKELFDKMGGWDKNIKSLQDWDFWLNAVKKHNAKGFYIPDIFFETTLPHPGGLSWDSHNNWVERTTTIKEKYGIPKRNICVTGAGARFHAKNVAKMLNADFLDMPSFKPHKYRMIYVVGFFGNVAQSFFNTDALRVVHWIGSDIMSLMLDQDKQRVAKTVEWIKNNVDVNFCEFEHTQKELASLGIKARILPLPPRKLFTPSPLPEEFTVAVYDPYANKAHYNHDLVKDIAKEMPEVKWKFFGDDTLLGKKDNIEHVGVIKPEDLENFIKTTSVLLRVTKHDGLPLSVIEWATAGRNIITNVPTIYNSIEVTDTKESIKKGIKKAMKAKLNTAGAEYYTELANHERYASVIKGLLEYNPEQYWENRAECWDKIEGQSTDAKEEYIISKEVSELNAASVLDIGCGNGKWFPILSENREYVGVDISKKLIDIAKKKYSTGTFIKADIRDLSKHFAGREKFDVIFSYTSLLHIPPQELSAAIDELKKIGKWLVMIEPQNEPNTNGIQYRQLHPEIMKAQEEGKLIYGVKSSFVHNYSNDLDIEKIIQLPPRTMMICKLS